MKVNRKYRHLQVGDLRNIVILKPPTYTNNGRGGTVVTFPSINWINAYAKVLPGSKERQMQQDQLTYDNIIELYVRYDADLNSDWKIEYDGKDYTIQQTNNVDSVNRFWFIIAYVKES